MIDSLSVTLMLVGAGFFLAGTLGLVRFPDVYTRLHALTKADNLGLGLIVLGLMLQAESVATAGVSLRAHQRRPMNVGPRVQVGNQIGTIGT